MPDLITPVILSGGAGTRLWPLSRRGAPKQLLPLTGERTLLQETARRVVGDRFAAPLVIGSHDHRDTVAEQLRAVDVFPWANVLEPFGRNTAPAVAVAALALAADDTMLVLPSDHAIRDLDAFMAAIDTAAAAAATGRLVTFGITPTAPATGFGYIERGAPLDGLAGAYAIAAFTEKPTPPEAGRHMARAGLWNGGIFLFRAGTYLTELERLAPDILAACRAALDGGERDRDVVRLDPDAFARAPAIAIDVAVMEKTAQGAVVPVDMGWDDIGSWAALWDLGAKDADGNVKLGDVIAAGSTDCYLRSDGPLVATVGLRAHVVVATGDAVLVAPRNAVQNVRELVGTLERDGRAEAHRPALVARPWGWARTLATGPDFHVRRLHVGAGHRIEMNHGATVQWVVASGSARLMMDGATQRLAAGEAIGIPAGSACALENAGDGVLEIVEVRAGNGES